MITNNVILQFLTSHLQMFESEITGFSAFVESASKTTQTDDFSTTFLLLKHSNWSTNIAANLQY